MSQDHEQDAEADPRAVARAIVLRQLSASAKSRRQLEDKLADRNVPEDGAREVLDRFDEDLPERTESILDRRGWLAG